jgi:transposase-like protein
MAPKKLSESEKKEIVQLYPQPEESTATLASRFGVSSSTISRILKQSLSDDDYNALVQQKRTGGAFSPSTKEKPTSRKSSASNEQDDTSRGSSLSSLIKRSPPGQSDDTSASDEETQSTATDQPSSDIEAERAERKPFPSKPKKQPTYDEDSGPRRRRRRSRVMDDDSEATQLPIIDVPGVPTDIVNAQTPWQDQADIEAVQPEAETYASRYDDDDDDLLDDDDDLDDDLMDDDDFDEDLDSDLEDEDSDEFEPIHVKPADLVEIVPFSSAELPRTCYLVIDRSAELITRPLQEFGELGNFPSAELMESTLPVFDNHRVAKRFANRRTQRIVKVPDSRILRKTTPYLQSKGITRLLIDGQVYSLTD